MNTGRGELYRALCQEALANLYNQRRRSVLALLGIVIGSASIVALLTIGHIAEREAMARFETVGVNSIAIIASAPANHWIDPQRLKGTIAGDARVESAHVAAVGTVSYQGRGEGQMVQLAAMTPHDIAAVAPPISEGRSLTMLDACQPTVVAGHGWQKDYAVRAGETVFLNDYGYTVVGILAEAQPQALGLVSFDKAMVTTLGCTTAILQGEGVNQVLLRIDPEADSEALGLSLIRQLTPTTDAKLELRQARELIEAMKAQLALMGGILLAVGSVSLLVGGIGVMNVMLMAVLERRREIGLRAALGASPRDIAFMFLCEALVLSVGGGVLGAMMGVGMVALASLFLPFGFTSSVAILITGTGVAAGVGLVFGLYPALSAARTQPVEALRAD